MQPLNLVKPFVAAALYVFLLASAVYASPITSAESDAYSQKDAPVVEMSARQTSGFSAIELDVWSEGQDQMYQDLVSYLGGSLNEAYNKIEDTIGNIFVGLFRPDATNNPNPTLSTLGTSPQKLEVESYGMVVTVYAMKSSDDSDSGTAWMTSVQATTDEAQGFAAQATDRIMQSEEIQICGWRWSSDPSSPSMYLIILIGWDNQEYGITPEGVATYFQMCEDASS